MMDPFTALIIIQTYFIVGDLIIDLVDGNGKSAFVRAGANMIENIRNPLPGITGPLGVNFNDDLLYYKKKP